MDIGWAGSVSSRRQIIPQCVVNQKATFTLNPALLGKCQPDDTACLCSQRVQNGKQPPFYGFFLTRICTDCPVEELGGKDPLEYLADQCPEIAAELQGRYTCIPKATAFPTLSLVSPGEETLPSQITLSLSTPTATVASRTSTVQIIMPSSTSSPFSIMTTSVDPTAPVSQATTSSLVDLPAITSSREKSGLSTGAVAGIAIAVAVPVILFVIAAVFFCWRRKKHSKNGWQVERSLSPELYQENGRETAYGAQMNVKPVRDQAMSPILQEKHRGGDHSVETREIYDNEEAMDSRVGLQRNQDFMKETARDMARAPEEKPVIGQGITGYQQKHSRGVPGTKGASGGIIRKELPSRNSVSGIPSSRVHSPPPLAHNTQQQPRRESRSSSRVSGTLRGPVPDMYAYAGVTIENEEELERLEDEERRIDEAIRESESRAQVRAENEDIRARPPHTRLTG